MDSLRYGNMVLTVELVTPTVAERWLKQNESNRRLRPKVIAMYAKDMASDNWSRKPAAICFTDDGKLGNGQHTLNAIVKSGRQQHLLIARYCTKAQIAAMDIGLKRTIDDVSHFLGHDMNRRQATIARIMAYGVDDDESRSFAELYAAYLQYEEAIDFVSEKSRSHRVGFNSPVLSVIASAWYTQDHDELARFLDILGSGVSSEPRDSAIIRLRDFCNGLRGGLGKSIRAETYRKTQAALDSYLNNRTMTKIYGVAKPIYTAPAFVSQ